MQCVRFLPGIVFYGVWVLFIEALKYFVVETVTGEGGKRSIIPRESLYGKSNPTERGAQLQAECPRSWRRHSNRIRESK